MKSVKTKIIEREYDEKKLIDILKNFNEGKFVADHGRNEIKKFFFGDTEISIKKFQKKGYLTQMYYKKIVGSKAKRSFYYAKKLIDLGVKTPKPIAYFDEFEISKGEKSSFYICEYLNYDFSCRDFLWNEETTKEVSEKLAGNENKVIEQFSKFTYDLHEKGVKFEDYSPGNVLVKENEQKNYDFYLVDLNRMKFKKNLGFSERMKNVSKIMEADEFIELFSETYAKYYKSKTKKQIFKKLKYYVTKHKFALFFKDNTRDFRRKLFKKREAK